jgi:hypothetical protein
VDVESGGEDDNKKYAKRNNPVVRMFQQFTGNQCPNILPMTTKDTGV